MSFGSILVANRGEIACRIMRTASSLGLRTVAIYSEPDAAAFHVKMADDSVCVGPGAAGESYLSIERILQAAQKTGAESVHPGYGFLSENADFANAVTDAGLVFIGPPAKAIAAMGNKAEAKRLMTDAGIPCVPGYHGKNQSDEALAEAAARIGFPVMIKAVAGGGGRGMRIVETAGALANAVKLARSEAANAFGNGDLMLEKALVCPRHVEMQIFSDVHGNFVHLGERDCSVQRRHQKIIEEAPCPVLSDELRDEMGKAAINAARAIGYTGAGTVEFLLDDDGAFYFLEMNTRLQVEHPVTEMITGIDLVALQIAVAGGGRLGFSQDDVKLTGHAVEARLYAENPAQDFLPSAGPVALWRPPDGAGIRVDGGITTGSEVSPFYDPLLAKIVAWGETREIARMRLVHALGQTAIHGPATNRDFLISALTSPGFSGGNATTGFVSEFLAGGIALPEEDRIFKAASLAAVLWFVSEREAAYACAGLVSPMLANWSSAHHPGSRHSFAYGDLQFHLAVAADNERHTIKCGNREIVITLVERQSDTTRFRLNQYMIDVSYHIDSERIILSDTTQTFQFANSGSSAIAGAQRDLPGRVTAPMHGRIVELFAETGQAVAPGDRLAVLEAMKMQHQVNAGSAGIVTSVHAKPDMQVAADDLLFEIEVTEDRQEQL